MRERLRINGEAVDVSVVSGANGTARVLLGGQEYCVEAVDLTDGELRFTLGGQRQRFSVLARPDGVLISDGRAYYSFPRIEEGASADDAPNAGQLVSQMPGTVLKLLIEPGASVAKGTALLILEAMKMEHEVCAPVDGVVAGYPKQAGERVMPGDLLVDFQPA